MSKNGLHRHYDRLGPEERFRLDVLAMARGDRRESDRLVGSCPRYRYTMNDRAFSGRWHGALELTIRAYLPLTDYLAKLDMIALFRQVGPVLEGLELETARDGFLEGHRAGARHAWAETGMDGQAPEWPLEVDEEAIKAGAVRSGLFSGALLDTLEKGLAQSAFNLWAAFGGFCAESMDVEAKKVLAVALGPGPVGRVENLEALADRLDLEVDADAVEAEREELSQAWKVAEWWGV